MGKFLALTLDARPEQIKNKTNHLLRSSGSTWIFGLLTAFAVLYLFLVNSLSTKGYEIKKLEKRIVELQEIQKRLGMESSALQSVQQIEETTKALNLVPSRWINYPQHSGYAYDDILQQ
mgnify:FL=1